MDDDSKAPIVPEDAAALLERGEAAAAELHRAYVDAIAARDGELNAYLRVVDEPDGDGVPIALKDLISTRGIETTAGSKILEGYVPVFDSTVIANCKAHGLPLLGKTNTDEFAMGSSTENSAFGPTRNPWNLDRVPGGSSGGPAAAVAAGEALLAPRITRRLIAEFAAARAAHQASEDRLVELTQRERDVLHCLNRGMAPKAIARVLGISLETCRGYVKSLHAKLGARSQLEAVVKAQRLGLLDKRDAS